MLDILNVWESQNEWQSAGTYAVCLHQWQKQDGYLLVDVALFNNSFHRATKIRTKHWVLQDANKKYHQAQFSVPPLENNPHYPLLREGFLSPQLTVRGWLVFTDPKPGIKTIFFYGGTRAALGEDRRTRLYAREPLPKISWRERLQSFLKPEKAKQPTLHLPYEWLSVGSYEVQVMETRWFHDWFCVRVGYRRHKKSKRGSSCRSNQWTLYDKNHYMYEPLSHLALGGLPPKLSPPLPWHELKDEETGGWLYYQLQPDTVPTRIQFRTNYVSYLVLEISL